MKKVLTIAKQPPSIFGSHTDAFNPVERRLMHQCIAIGVAGVALLGACATPIASADYPADKKKYDDCVAKEKIDYPVPPGMSYWLEREIRRNCGDPPTRPKDEKK